MVKASHGACGKSWNQVGNRTSHCATCHETFASLALFDAHRAGPHGLTRQCQDPRGMVDHGVPLAFDESIPAWYSPYAADKAAAYFAGLSSDSGDS